MKKYKAFTLAEVLITLIIMGVISALTVPAIKKVSEERTYVSGVKKAYYTITSAVKDIKRTEGAVSSWGANANNLIKSRMNLAGSNVGTYTITMLNNGESSWGQLFGGVNGFATVDGMLWYKTNMSTGAGTGYKIIILVDINGKSAPNIVGVDVHGFWIAADGAVYPLGGGPGASTAGCSSADSGWGCTARVIQEGKISW